MPPPRLPFFPAPGILPLSFWDHVRELLGVVHLRRVNERPDEKVEEHQYEKP